MSTPNFTQWELIFLDFGEYLDKYSNLQNYTKNDFTMGVNLGNEFSQPHMAIVISPNFTNKGGNIVVLPITSFTNGDEKHKDKIVLEKGDYNFLTKKSSINVSAIRSISKDRVNRQVRPFIPEQLKEQVKNRLSNLFCK